MSHTGIDNTHFQQIGGEPAVRELVERFYDLMELETPYTGIRALHPADLAHSRDKLFWFLCGWLGGPQHYIERFGHPRLRARHMPFAIGEPERDQWMACMRQAMGELKLDPRLQRELGDAFHKTADFMRNS
ncbi:MAG TPA: group II truncated hemoglobin [Rhodocyclaceae bacterium]